jgi:DNA primase
VTSRVELVLEKLGVTHRRQGNRVWAEECPLPSHGKPNPQHRYLNWMIRPEGERAGLFYCYSCKGKGNLPELVMILKELDYRAAREWLRTFGDQEPEDPYLRVRVGVDRGQGALEVPPGVEQQGASLAEWNSVPREYAVSRGLTDDQVRRWRIGYATFGRLEGRIFLPIYDPRGRLANYAARTFVQDEKRYLAAPSWDRPDSSALFGEHRWPEPGFRSDVLLFEGALNGLALERALGDSDAHLAGMSGLDQSEQGIEVRTLTKLATFRRVIVCTDPDGPGERAADAVRAALGRRMPVVRLELPDGTDAADLPRDALVGRLGAALRGQCC